jgi:hypothetical protein
MQNIFTFMRSIDLWQIADYSGTGMRRKALL